MTKLLRTTLALSLGLYLCLGGALLSAAPTPDNDAAKVYNASPCSSSFSANYNTLAGSNQVLLVTVECETCSAPSTVSYNGSALSLVLADTNANLNEWTYAMVAPPTGSALPVAVTLGASYCSPVAVFAVSYSGVNQATPIGNKAGWVGATSMSNGVNSVNLAFTPSNTNGTVVEISYERQPSGASLALSNGSVRFVSNNVTNNSNGDYGFGDWSPGSVSAVTLNYTWNLPGTYTSNYTDVQAIELLPYVAASSPTPTLTPTPTVICNGTLYNPGMELPNGGGPFVDAYAYNNWYYYSDACGSVAQPTSPVHSGSMSLEASAAGCGLYQGSYWVQNIGCLNTSCTYTFCVWVQTNTSSATSQIFISAEYKNASGTDLGSPNVDYNISNANGVWVQHCVTISSFPVGFDHLRLVLGNQNPGAASNAWFDDATFVQSCPSPTPTVTPTVSPSFSITPTVTVTPTPSWTPTRTPTRTPTQSPSATATFSPSPSPSPSPTPAMALTKTSNVSVATIGDTLTFCIAYKNDSSGTVTMNVWDTVSADLTYAGCNGGCSRSANLVQWSIAGVGAGATGNVCFWGVVSGYPFMPGQPERLAWLGPEPEP